MPILEPVLRKCDVLLYLAQPQMSFGSAIESILWQRSVEFRLHIAFDSAQLYRGLHAYERHPKVHICRIHGRQSFAGRLDAMAEHFMSEFLAIQEPETFSVRERLSESIDELERTGASVLLAEAVDADRSVANRNGVPDWLIPRLPTLVVRKAWLERLMANKAQPLTEGSFHCAIREAYEAGAVALLPKTVVRSIPQRERRARGNVQVVHSTGNAKSSRDTVSTKGVGVSIIITARNYARYLPDAIESALSQSVECEVIYSDDASTDHSISIARQYESRGVIVVDYPRHGGVCAARNRGAAVARGEYLLFLDGDDMMPPDFVAKHLAAFEPSSPFVYGPALAVGDGPDVGTLWQVPQWQRERGGLWRWNFCNTSSMIRRWAFEAAGRWRDGAGSYWDWDLFLRASRFGDPRPSTAVLSYRQHGGSWSRQNGERHPDIGYSKMRLVRRLNARLSIGCVYSGRLPGLLPEWLEAIAQSVANCPLPELPELVILDNSPEDHGAALRDTVRRYAPGFAAVRIVPHRAGYTWQTELERRDRVAEFMAGACRRLQEFARNELVWLVEDDLIVSPDACRALWEAVTDGLVLTNAAAGAYRSRHAPERFVGGVWQDGQPVEITEFASDDPIPVDFTGTGCLMYWKDMGTGRWQSHVDYCGMPANGPGPRRIAAHDWAWCMEVKRRNGRVLLLPSVRCRHYQSETTYV